MNRFTALLLLACGSPPAVQVPHGATVLPAGQYHVSAQATSTEGACDWLLKNTLSGYISVNDHGAFVSPLPELVSCITRYEPFSVSCSGLGMAGSLTGTVWNDDGIWEGAGTGSAHDDIGGCKRATFTWWMVRYDRDGGK